MGQDLWAADDGSYDPLTVFNVDADDGDFDESGGQMGPHADPLSKAVFAVRSADLPAEQRIEELFAALATRRRVLMGILSFLDEPRRADALQDKVDELQEHDVSVYSGYDYSLLLEEAGAVRKVDADGGEFDEDAEQAPDVVEVDGTCFYKPTDGKQVHWALTDEGRAYLEADDPLGRLAALLEEEPQHRAAYAGMLALCRERGRSVEELAAFVDGLDLPEGARRHCSYFARKLELADALAWSGGWRTTASGERGLVSLFADDADEGLSTEGGGVAMANEPLEEAVGAAELVEVLGQRSATYALLSRLYLREVDQELLDELHEMLYPVETGDAAMDEGYLLLATYLSNLWTGSLSELKVDFARCFFGNGVDGYAAAYPYESVYTSEKRLMMQDARDEVLAIYRAHGVGKAADWKEGEDHIALELEFERVMGDRVIEALRAGDEGAARGLLAAQLGFLEDHLASWAPMMTADMRRRAQTKLYLGLACLTEGWLRTDLRFLQDALADGDGGPNEGAQG